MKRLLFTFMFFCSIGFCMAQTSYTIVAAGDFYAPDSLVVNVGDTIIFDVGINHPTLEVNLATYNANGTTPLTGGFAFPSGQGSFVVTTAQTYYYVCTNHISMGMKGKIIAQATIDLPEDALAKINIFPNPVEDVLNFSLPENVSMSDIRITDISGKEVKHPNARKISDRQINVARLKAGTYILIIETGENTMIDYRFVKS